jgi:uncharacterized membrane protein YhiD involved in acid resistance
MKRLSSVLMCLWLLGAVATFAAPQLPPPPSQNPLTAATDDPLQTMQEVRLAAKRLPLAALLGAALALRPRRRGTPPRNTAVVETQIILAAVGALIMLIVGASLARAFGIVGAANLIRYRSKIDDPKDAVVMLCALAVGLAAGVGLYYLAPLATVFLVALLWVIESFEPQTYKLFELKVEAEKKAESLRPKVEEVLAKYNLPYEVRTLSADELAFSVQVPINVQTDAISLTIVNLAPKNEVKVDWNEKKPKGSLTQ